MIIICTVMFYLLSVPVNPERFVGGLGGAMMAVIIVSALMAAAVPAAASGAYYKR